MLDRSVVKGLVLVAIALVFAIQSLSFQLGPASQPGPGLFPVIISTMLGLVGLAITASAFMGQREALTMELRNLSIIVAALGAFGLLSQAVNMATGIVGLVVISTLAGPGISAIRKAALACTLLLIAFAFWKLLGLQLPLL